MNDGLQRMLKEACGLLVLFRHVPGVTDENDGKRFQGPRHHGGDVKRPSLELRSGK